jgi:eukaryotic-like serine/threonine-protein kinase
MTAVDTSNFPAGYVVAERYRIHRLLGAGGMGAVYEAEHIALERRVALKVLLPAFAADSAVVARFMQEARAAAAIGAPGIVEVFDLGNDGGLAYIAMEKLEGEELYDRIVRGHPLPAAYVARIGAALADAIASAHEHGIIHRDLKPQNVFLAKRGRDEVVKVLDFGIAKLQQGGRADAPVTRTGQVFGTPLYMAPEQLHGSKDMDGRVDVYAMGAILYEALTGNPPFSATSYPELIIKITSETPKPLRQVRPDIPPQLASIVAGAMEKDCDARIQSAAALRDALERCLRTGDNKAWADTIPSGEHPSVAPPPPTGGWRKRVPWVVGGVALSVAMVVAMAMRGGDDASVGRAQSGDDPVASVDTPAAPSEDEARDEAPGAPVAHEPPSNEVDPPASAPMRLVTEPADARILVDGHPECTSPCEIVAGDEPLHVTVKRRGYRTLKQSIEPPCPAELPLKLERRRPPSSPAAPSSGTLPSLLPR